MTIPTRSENIAYAIAGGFSPVGYVAASALAFDGATVETVTVERGGTVERTATVHVDGADGPCTFYAVDGRWYDRAGLPLLALDSTLLDRHADVVIGARDDIGAISPGDRAPVRHYAAAAILSYNA